MANGGMMREQEKELCSIRTVKNMKVNIIMEGKKENADFKKIGFSAM